VSPDTKVVLHAARLTSIKGHRDLIAAAELLDADGALDDAVFILAGDGTRDAYREELLGLIAKHGLGDKVRLVGHCREMPQAYLASQVAVTTSTVPETFGRTSAEAQAMGCPVIVPNLGALPETIVSPEDRETGFTGWLFSARDAAALAVRIAQALALTPKERDAIGKRARGHVADRFMLEQMQVATLEVYDELLGTDLADSFMRALPAELGAGGADNR
jgi:glycosyltransferase involved in cell wall biosynthesis